MPVSYYQIAPIILDHVIAEHPATVLDVGIGFGKYGMLVREVLDLPYERYDQKDWLVQIDGVEIHEGYKNPIYEYIYKNLYYGNIQDMLPSLGKYDVILLLDLIQNFTEQEGKELIKELLLKTNKALLITTPLYPHSQPYYLDNPHEKHIRRWSQIDFTDFDFHYEEFKIGDNGAQIIKIYPPKQQMEEYPIDEYLARSPQEIGKRESLKITFILPHKSMTGGLKMLVEQMKWLQKRGHQVHALLRTNDPSFPIFHEHMKIYISKETVIPPSEPYKNYLEDTDIVVAGFFDQLIELSSTPYPVIYWEQGYPFLFGEIPREYNVPIQREYMQQNYSRNVALLASSQLLSNIVFTKFQRKAPILPCCIDLTIFNPKKTEKTDPIPTILLISNPSVRLKGSSVALDTLERVWRLGVRFKVKWVMPYQCNLPVKSYPIEYVINPSQEKLASIFHDSSLLLWTSLYEGFGLPPLEAMASGVPVVSTKCGGIDMYAEHGKNALLFDSGDIHGLAGGIIRLLYDEELRRNLTENGIQTAQNFSYEKNVIQLEEYLWKALEFFHINP